MGTEIQTFDIAALRMKLRSQQQDRRFEGGQRIAGAIADILNDHLDAILNALALYQGQPELVVALPPKPIPAPLVNRHAKPDEEIVAPLPTDIEE